jgi:hypothetical protein
VHIGVVRLRFELAEPVHRIGVRRLTGRALSKFVSLARLMILVSRPADREPRYFPCDNPPTCCAVSKDETLAVVGDSRGRVMVFDLPA